MAHRRVVRAGGALHRPRGRHAREAVIGLFPTAAEVAAGAFGEERVGWGAAKPIFPFASGALNRLVVHDAVLDLAEELLGTDRIRLYQGW